MRNTTVEISKSNAATASLAVNSSLKKLLGKETLKSIEVSGASTGRRNPIKLLKQPQDGGAIHDSSQKQNQAVTKTQMGRNERRAKNNEDVLNSVSNDFLRTLKGFTMNSQVPKPSRVLKKTKSLPKIARNNEDIATEFFKSSLNRTGTVEGFQPSAI